MKLQPLGVEVGHPTAQHAVSLGIELPPQRPMWIPLALRGQALLSHLQTLKVQIKF